MKLTEFSQTQLIKQNKYQKLLNQKSVERMQLSTTLRNNYKEWIEQNDTHSIIPKNNLQDLPHKYIEQAQTYCCNSKDDANIGLINNMYGFVPKFKNSYFNSPRNDELEDEQHSISIKKVNQQRLKECFQIQKDNEVRLMQATNPDMQQAQIQKHALTMRNQLGRRHSISSLESSSSKILSKAKSNLILTQKSKIKLELHIPANIKYWDTAPSPQALPKLLVKSLQKNE